MKEFKNVHGNSNEPLYVGLTTVYVRSNIKDISTEETPNLYEYDEVQYTKDEFMDLITKKGDKNEQDIEDTQLGLVEVYEYTDGAYSEVTDLQQAVVELYEIIIGE